MNKKSLRYIRVFLVVMLSLGMVLQAGASLVLADSALNVSRTVEGNTVSFQVSGDAGANNAVSILVMRKNPGSVVYMDQAALSNGEHTFMTVLPKGDYTGYVNTAGGDRMQLEDFSIATEESIVGFKSLQTITVAKGAALKLPVSVIAVFDSGANREVGVQWTNVPDTAAAGQYTVSGQVKGTANPVQIGVVVSGTTTPTQPTEPAQPAQPSTPAVNGSTVTVKTALDPATGTAKAQVAEASLTAAFANAAADSKGVKTVELVLEKVEGAKAYEPLLPASALTQGNLKQVIKISTPAGAVELPGNMVQAGSAAGYSSISLSIAAADPSSITDAKAKAAVGDRPAVELNLKMDGKAVSWQNKAAPVQVSIPYQPSAEELSNNEHIGIWHIDGASQAVKITSSRFNEATGLVTFKTTHFSTFAVAYEKKTFNDAGVYPWAQKPIEVLASKGIINGTSESAFSPAENITRADFLMLLVNTLGISADFTDNFSDVGKSDYYYEALGTAKKLGISNGVDNNRFQPDAYISRQDLMVLSARAFEAAGLAMAQGSAVELQHFMDRSDIASYAVPGIASMVKEGIVTGSGDRLNPQDNATRAETAVIMYRIYHKL